MFRQVNNSSEKTSKRLVLRSKHHPEIPEKSIEAATRRRYLKKLLRKTPVEHLQTAASKVQKNIFEGVHILIELKAPGMK